MPPYSYAVVDGFEVDLNGTIGALFLGMWPVLTSRWAFELTHITSTRQSPGGSVSLFTLETSSLTINGAWYIDSTASPRCRLGIILGILENETAYGCKLR